MAKIPSAQIQPREGYVFPDMENISYEDKQKPEYSLQVMKAVYTHYTGNSGDVPFSNTDDYIEMLRTIAQGRQSAEQYKSFFVGSSLPSPNVMDDLDTTLDANAEASRKGWFTGYWKALSPIPNYMTRCLGEFLKNDVDIKMFCTDVDANMIETERMNLDWVKSSKKIKPITNMLRGIVGLPKTDDATTDSYEALKNIKEEGGYKERYIIASEQVISHTEDVSNWKLKLKEKLFKDLFTIGAAFAVLDSDVTESKVEWKYKDIKDVINQFCYEKDGKDSNYFGWFDYPSINEIRAIQDRIVNVETGKVGLGPEDFNNIGGKYKDYGGNANSNYYTKNHRERDEIDLKGCTMKLRWVDVEKKKSSEFINKGRSSYVPYKKGHENNKAYKVTETRKFKRYSCVWLVGTSYVWDYGIDANQTYKDRMPSLGFAEFKLQEESYIERLVPIAHVFAISWLKFINALSKSLSDFIAVDIDKIAKFSDGEKKYDPLTAIKILRQELVYFYRGGQGLQQTGGGKDVGISRVPGTAMEDIMKELTVMETQLKLAEYVTGLSPMAAGITPDKDTPVSTSMASLNSSNVALSYIMNAVMVMKTDLAEQTLPMVSNLIEVDPRAEKYYSGVIGADDVATLKEYRGSLTKLGIKPYPRPSDEMKNQLVAYLNAAVENGLMDAPVAMRIGYHLYRGGNFLKMLYKAEYLLKVEKERQFKEKQALIKEQSAGNEKAAQIQAQASKEIEAARMRFDENRERARSSTQVNVDDNKFSNELIGKVIDDQIEKGIPPDNILSGIRSMISQTKGQVAEALQ